MKKIAVMLLGVLTIGVVIGSIILNKHRYNAENRLDSVYKRLVVNAGEYTLPSSVEVLDTENANAYTNGIDIKITKGLLKMIRNDDQLAMVLAHEMSHMILEDYKIESMSQARKEAHADKLGAFILMRSGFSICKGKNVFKLFLERFGDTADTGSHPDFAYRLNQLSLPSCGHFYD